MHPNKQNKIHANIQGGTTGIKQSCILDININCRHISVAGFLILILLCCIVPVSALEPEKANITIGVILPLTGDDNVAGSHLLQGIQVAADEINADETCRYQVDLQVADDTGDPDRALTLFKEMQTDSIPVVIGSYTTTLTLPMARETGKSDTTLLISPQANGESLYGISPLFYQVNPPIFALAQFVSEWLAYTSDRPALVYVQDKYGESVLNHILKGLIEQDFQISGTYPVLPEENDFSSFTRTILDKAPDAIVIIMYDTRQIPLIRNISEAGYRGQVLLTESSCLENLEKEETDALSRFPLFTISAYTNLVPGDHSDRFVQSYQEAFGNDPSKTLAGYGYDSMMLIADAFRNGNGEENITAEMIKEGLDNSRYYGVTGPKIFDMNHAPTSAMDRWGFKDGRFELMTISLV